MDPETREFLERQFATIDQRFTRVESEFRSELRGVRQDVAEKFEETKRHVGVVVEGLRQDVAEKFEETKRHVGVVVEGLRGDIRQVAEGHDVLRGEIADLRQETQEGFREIKTLLRVSYADLDLKHADLAGRVERLEQGDDQP